MAPALAEKTDRDYAGIALEYARDVVDGRLDVCLYAIQAAQRMIDDLDRAESADPAFPFEFSPWHAGDVCGFVEKLPHVEGRWSSPTIVLEPVQIFILANVFGWRRRSDGLRRFSMVYIEWPRKSAKSTLSAAVGLYCATCEDEPGVQVKCAATTGKQAGIVFGYARDMVNASPDLIEAFDVDAYTHEIRVGGRVAMDKINAKASTQDGLNPHLAIIDEVHAHKDRALYDVLRSARAARRNPLTWQITTAGYWFDGVCYEQRSLLVKILAGIVPADHYFGIIFTTNKGDDWRDPVAWRRANPMWNVSVDPLEFENYALEAQASPESVSEFRTKYLCQWLGAASPWLDIDQWDACAEPSMRLEDFAGERGYIANDLAQKNDLCATAIVFDRDNCWHGFVRFWLPEGLLDDVAKRNEHIKAWADAGHIELTPGDMTDYSRIEETIEGWSETFDLAPIAFDPYQSHQIATSLQSKGHETVQIGNTVKNMSDPAKELEARLRPRLFRHTGCPVLRWNASNVVVWRDQKSNILPKKERPNSSQKIDGIVALVLAINRILLEGPGRPSVYESRGIRVVG